jgi:hypothetical protein
VNNDIQYETFGSNIHELFTDSFFLEGGLIGEFAKKQIQRIIDWCSEETKKDYKQMRSMIAIIGEPIIRVKIAEMYASKMGENIEATRLQTQIDYLQNRLKDIKQNDSN